MPIGATIPVIIPRARLTPRFGQDGFQRNVLQPVDAVQKRVGFPVQAPLAPSTGPTLSGWKVPGSTVTIDGKSWTLHNSGRLGTILQDVVLSNLFQFEVIPGDEWLPVDAGHGVERSEIRCLPLFNYNQAYSNSYMMRIFDPGFKDAASDGWILMGQLHASPDVGDAGIGPAWAREIRSFPRTIQYNRRTSMVDPIVTNPSSTYNYIDKQPANNWGKWISVVEQHLIDPTGGTGYHKVYHDGVLMYDTGLINTGYVDADGPYLKYGIYRDKDATSTLRVQFYFNGSIMA